MIFRPPEDVEEAEAEVEVEEEDVEEEESGKEAAPPSSAIFVK